MKSNKLKQLIKENISNLVTEQVTSMINSTNNQDFWEMFPTGYAAQFPFTMQSPSNNFADSNGMMIGIAANNDNLNQYCDQLYYADGFSETDRISYYFKN